MLGLREILFTAVVVVVIWLGFKWVGRLQDRRKAQARQQARQRRRGVRRAASKSAEAVEDLVPCPACGDYVAAQGASRCDRGNCPYFG